MAKQTDGQLKTASTLITVEVTDEANTATRVGNTLFDIADSKINVDKISTNATLDAASDEKIPSVKATNALVVTSNSLKEDISNKSIDILSDGASDIKYPSAKAVANYVVSQMPDMSGKENVSNKSINIITDAASDVKYPSVKSVKTYVDSVISTTPSPSFQEAYLKLWQTGTANPTVSMFYDNISTGDWTESDPNWLSITLIRESVGTYRVQLNTKDSNMRAPIQTYKLLIMFGANNIVIGDAIMSADAYYHFAYIKFQTYNNSGVLSDNVLNNTTLSIKLLP